MVSHQVGFVAEAAEGLEHVSDGDGGAAVFKEGLWSNKEDSHCQAENWYGIERVASPGYSRCDTLLAK
jgi:hypothetical protein